MTVTLEDLADYVGASPSEPTLALIFEAAPTMINDHLGQRGRQKIPAATYDLAVLQLGSELWIRRNSPGGVMSWANGDVPARLAADAMRSVRPMIDRYKGLGTPG
jgi:hypothetical protein